MLCKGLERARALEPDLAPLDGGSEEGGKPSEGGEGGEEEPDKPGEGKPEGEEGSAKPKGVEEEMRE